MREVEHGKRIRGLRSKLGMSQQQFADKLGVSQGTVSRWEKDQQLPSVDALKTMQNLGSFEDHHAIEDVRVAFAKPAWIREVNIVGATEVNKLVDNIDWPKSEWIKINIPDVPAWRGFEIKAYLVVETTIRFDFPNGSVVFVTPFVGGKLEPRDGDFVLFAELHPRSKRYEVLLAQYNIYKGGFSIGVEGGFYLEFSTSLDSKPLQRQDYENLGFVGLVIGNFAIFDSSRLSALTPNHGDGE